MVNYDHVDWVEDEEVVVLKEEVGVLKKGVGALEQDDVLEQDLGWAKAKLQDLVREDLGKDVLEAESKTHMSDMYSKCNKKKLHTGGGEGIFRLSLL